MVLSHRKVCTVAALPARDASKVCWIYLKKQITQRKGPVSKQNGTLLSLKLYSQSPNHPENCYIRMDVR